MVIFRSGIFLCLVHHPGLFRLNLRLRRCILILFGGSFILKFLRVRIAGLYSLLSLIDDTVDPLKKKYPDNRIPDQKIDDGKDQIYIKS